MEQIEFVSLFVISLAAFVCPALSQLVPNRIVPETVLLLLVGMVVGPNMTGIVQTGDAIMLLSDLGLGFLFLLAGYEIEVKELSGKGGRHGLVTWFATFAIALTVAIPLGLARDNLLGGFAAAIILTTTAFGTLVPILKERGLTNTAIGRCVVEYGIWGELCPVLAMALLLTTRAKWLTVALLAAFVVIAVLAALLSRRIQDEDTKIARLVRTNAETNSQMSVRAVLVLLVGLVTLSALFNLDIVLGAFAAGFVLRAVLPAGNSSLEHKLNGLAYGFFIPLFFVVSGTKIDPVGVASDPGMLLLFIGSLVLVRTIPIFVSLSWRPDTSTLDARARASIAFYCTTALPIIVAVVSVATTAGAFSQEVGSVLIAAGGITVMLMPLLGYITLRALDADLGQAARKIAANPRRTVGVIKEHHALERERNARRKHKGRNGDTPEDVPPAAPSDESSRERATRR